MTTVNELMTRDVASCGTSDRLSRAAQIMWERDCGCVPVLDDERRVVGMITDRDLCMAAYTSGRRLDEIAVREAMSATLYTCGPADPLEAVERVMQTVHIRRLPVVDGSRHLVGLLSLNDIARFGQYAFGMRCDGLASDAVARTLASVGESRRPSGSEGATQR